MRQKAEPQKRYWRNGAGQQSEFVFIIIFVKKDFLKPTEIKKV